MYSVSEKIWRLEEAFLDRIEKLEDFQKTSVEKIKELENELHNLKALLQTQIDDIRKRNLKV